MDTLPFDDPHRERKLKDKNRRYDKMYDEIAELEKKIEDADRKKKAVLCNALNLEQIYRLLLNFDKFFYKMKDSEQRDILSYIVKEIEIYNEAMRKDLSRLKSITFQFPLKYGDKMGDTILWDNKRQVETCCLLYKTDSKQNK